MLQVLRSPEASITHLAGHGTRSEELRLRHYFVGSKDVSAQFLAADLTVEVFPGESWQTVHAEALARFRWAMD